MKIYKIEMRIPSDNEPMKISFNVFVKSKDDAFEILEAMYYSIGLLVNMGVIASLNIEEELPDMIERMAHAMILFKKGKIWKSEEWLHDDYLKDTWSLEEIEEKDLSIEDKLSYKNFTNQTITVKDILWTT